MPCLKEALHPSRPACRGEWEKIGEVVGGDDTMAAGSKWYNGQQWDYGALLQPAGCRLLCF